MNTDVPEDDGLFILHDSSSALVREVFAHFGLAIYQSNCLEREISGALLCLEWRLRLQPPMTQEEYHKSFDSFYTTLKGMPMGRLIARLKQIPAIPDDIIHALDKCLVARNTLAHHYFWERAGELLIPHGQRKMIEECDCFSKLFAETDKRIHEYKKPYAESHGLTDEIIAEEQDRIIEAAKRKLL